MLDKQPKITEPNLSDRVRMNDYNLDQYTARTMKELHAELDESILRLELQIKTLTERLDEVKSKKENYETIRDGIDRVRM